MPKIPLTLMLAILLKTLLFREELMFLIENRIFNNLTIKHLKGEKTVIL
jgi:hypothetical protein